MPSSPRPTQAITPLSYIGDKLAVEMLIDALGTDKPLLRSRAYMQLIKPLGSARATLA